MATPAFSRPTLGLAPLPLLLDNIPILYEDEDEGDMGESNQHVDTDEILHVCVAAHLKPRPELRAFSNMNLYYRKRPLHRRTRSKPYVSPDLMVVEPFRDLGANVSSYEIGVDGPAPLATAEILSQRSGQQSDLKKKPIIYAQLGVPEYILVDRSGRYLKERLLLRRLQPDRTWEDRQDPDGGVTSLLGFRLIWDADGRLRVLDAATGAKYVRPDEAQGVMDEVERLQAEIARLKQAQKPGKK